MNVFGFVICLFGALQTSDAAVTWLHSEDAVSFAEGRTATLFWSFDVGSGKSWGKVEISRNSIKSDTGKEVLVYILKSKMNKTVELKSRAADIDLVVLGTSNIVNVTFTLRNLVRSTDDKYYRVYVINNDFTSEGSYTKLLVLVLPGPSLIQVQPVDQVSCQGKNVSLTCNATVGNPADTSFTFYRNNEVVTSLSGILDGDEVKATHNIALIGGNNSFTCAANNLAGTADNSTAVNITAKEPPEITNCNDKTAIEGTNLVLRCQATGSQPITTSWMKGNQVISSANALNITTITRSDAGMYRFTASNGDECRNATKYVNLTVHYKPGTPNIQVQPIDEVSCQGKHVNLTCNAAVGNPVDTSFTFYRNNKAITTPSGTLDGNKVKATHTVELIAGNNSFTCAANNSAGTADSSTAVNITAKEPPKIANCNEKTAIEGTNLIWTCQVTGSQPITTSWMKGNQVISSANTLNITTITRSNAGMYRFTASNGNGCLNATKAVNLIVHYKPSINQTGKVCVLHRVAEKGNINIDCKAEGEPTPTITWTKDGIPLPQKGSPLVLQNVMRNQAGNYTCTANNTIGNDTACWTLDVQYEPEGLQVVNAKDGVLVVDEGQPINITCKSKGNPSPSYHWTNNNVPLSDDNSTMIIKEADVINDGVYVCTAKNSLGTSSINVTLRVHYFRNATCNALPAVLVGSSITLNCSAAGYPPVNYTWTGGNVSVQQSYTTVTATPSLNGVTFTCKAANDRGTSTCTRSLTVYYKPINVRVDPPSLVVNKTGSFNLTCNGSANPAANYSWSKDGQDLVNEKSHVLTRRNVTRQEAGNYTCTVTNYLGSEHSKSSVHVQSLPLFQSCQSSFTVVDNVKKVFRCNMASGYPFPSYTIKYKGKPYQTSTLELNVKRENNDSLIRCTASNSVGSSYCNTTLIVNYKPSDIKVDPPSLVVNKTGSFNLTCTGSANPAANYSWSKDGQDLVDGKSHVLTRRNVTRQEAGNYTCTVTNIVGSGDSHSSVHVQYKPQFQSCQSSFTVEENVKKVFGCNMASGYPSPSYTIQYKGKPYQTSTLELNVKREDSDSVIRCTASNSVGSSDCNTILIVNYKPSDIKVNPPSLAVNKTDSFTLTCNGSANPAANYSWSKDGEDLVNEKSHVLTRHNVTEKNAGKYNCTVTNTVGSGYNHSSVYIWYPYQRPCNRTYGLIENGCVNETTDTYLPGVKCSTAEVDLNENGFDIIICPKKLKQFSCTFNSNNRECHLEINVTETIEETKYTGVFTVTNKDYDKDLNNKESNTFKAFAKKVLAMLWLAYKNQQFVRSIEVKSFRKGSVIVEYELKLIADVSDPSLPLKQALANGGGTLNGLEIDPSSIEGSYEEPSTAPLTPEPPVLTTEIIIVIAVVAAVVFIVIIVLICCCCCKNKSKHHRNGSLNISQDQEYNAGIVNPATSPSPPTYAKQGPHPSTSDQTKNNNQDNTDQAVAPTYAQVDIKKKSTKKQPGEVTYADLSEFRQNDDQAGQNGDIPLQSLPDNDKAVMPPKYEETDYAEIVGFQKAREAKKDDKQDGEAEEKPKSEETAGTEVAEKGDKEDSSPNQPSSSQTSGTPSDVNVAEKETSSLNRPSSSQNSVDSLPTRDRNNTTLTTVSL